MGKYIRMPQVKQLKSKKFTTNKEIIKQENGIELTFTLKINIKIKHFSQEFYRLSS